MNITELDLYNALENLLAALTVYLEGPDSGERRIEVLMLPTQKAIHALNQANPARRPVNPRPIQNPSCPTCAKIPGDYGGIPCPSCGRMICQLFPEESTDVR